MTRNQFTRNSTGRKVQQVQQVQRVQFTSRCWCTSYVVHIALNPFSPLLVSKLDGVVYRESHTNNITYCTSYVVHIALNPLNSLNILNAKKTVPVLKIVPQARSGSRLNISFCNHRGKPNSPGESTIYRLTTIHKRKRPKYL